MIQKLKQSKEIKYHLESGDGYYVVEHTLIPFNIKDLDDVEVFKYIIENGKEELSQYEIERKTKGRIYEYWIHNNGDYEFAEVANVYSTLYLTKEEFEQICKKAQEFLKKEGGRSKDVFYIKYELLNRYPEIFLQIADGQGFISYEWED